MNENTLQRSMISPSTLLKNKVLQFGGGNFLRAFVDWMIQELNDKTDFDSNVIVIKPTNNGAYDALRKQEGLFHVLTNGIKDGKLVSDIQLITCINQVINPYKEWDTFLKSAEDPDVRFIVSNTTEAGIQFSTNDQLEDHPAHEFPGKLTQWLYHRFEFFNGDKTKACIFLPCELIESNGQKLRSCILDYATNWNLPNTFSDWIQKENKFCNTLVDRIVPGFPKDQATEVFEKINCHDELLVSAEPYHIWVIETNIDIEAEIPFSKAGLNIVLTHDLQDYRTLKVRILNGAHTLMVPVGYLSSVETVREAVEDQDVGQFITDAINEEIMPSLSFPKETLQTYAGDVLDRFKNPFVQHRLLSISLNSIAKFKTRLFPTLLDYHAKTGKLPKRIVFSLASLLWFYRGKRGAEKIALNDNKEVLQFFEELWQNYEMKKISLDRLVSTILQKQEFWNSDLTNIPYLQNQLVRIITRFEEQGFELFIDGNE